MKLPSGQGGRGLSNLAFAAAIASNVKTTHLHTTPNLRTPARPSGFLSSPSTLSHIPSSQINKLCIFDLLNTSPSPPGLSFDLELPTSTGKGPAHPPST
ncbi:hypothetical protein FJTKL_02848 [Diaporthe vaccinii]|uniref:Uncharacterized protein n=1 Tax=Diaporthe vaccinii TaxID=105482 RepID=A0ABR4F385_9PEZI